MRSRLALFRLLAIVIVLVFPIRTESITSTIMSMSKSQARRIDMHVHMVGNGVAGSGGWLRLHGWLSLAGAFHGAAGRLSPAVLEQDLESIYAEHLLATVRASSFDAVVLLRTSACTIPTARRGDDLGAMYVPNDVVLDLAAAHPEFLAGVSIHPARRDALEELDRCIERGAVLMKCLPNCQNIDPSDARYRPFLGTNGGSASLPLLAHTGGEHTLPVVNPRLADPKLLRLPLECGVTVIAAHCATKSGPLDPDYFDDWAGCWRSSRSFMATSARWFR